MSNFGLMAEWSAITKYLVEATQIVQLIGADISRSRNRLLDQKRARLRLVIGKHDAINQIPAGANEKSHLFVVVEQADLLAVLPMEARVHQVHS